MYRSLCVLLVFGWIGLVTCVTGRASAQDAAETPLGAQVFVAQKCLVCHAVAGKGNKNGPLDDVGARLSADEIREWIVQGPEMMIKTKAQRKPPMRAYPNLENDDLDALVAYLQTLKGQ